LAEPTTLNLTVKRGATLYVEIECFQSDGLTPLNISTFIFTGSVKTSPNSGMVATLNVGYKSGTTNVLTIAMADDVSASIPTSGGNFAVTENYYHDIKADTGSQTEYWFQGNFTVIPRVTV